MKGLECWKSLADTLLEYVEHKESKFDGKEGLLYRKRVIVNDIIYVGKEANNIEENLAGLKKVNYAAYVVKKELKERLLKMTPMEARRIGLNTETLRQVKKMARENRFRISKKIISILCNCQYT